LFVRDLKHKNPKKYLWKIFSEYIRRKDADKNGMVKCVTCGTPKHWKDLDAGHYISKNKGMAVYFNELNINPQCTHCNRYLHGNLINYTLYMQRKYGMGIVEDLKRQSKKVIKFSNYQYEVLINEYLQKLKQLKEN
jgi:hypothetical protein